MIHVILRGDFGNQLFQYAIGRKLALQYDTELQFILSNRWSLSDWNGSKLREKIGFFDLKVQYSHWPPLGIKLRHILNLENPSHGTYFVEKTWGYDPDVLKLPDESFLFGYFQSEKYFTDIESIIRQDLKITFKTEDLQTAELEKKICNTESVSLHIRRGDYLKSARHNVCTLEYYKQATAIIQKELKSPRFFIFSDDIAWCKENFTDDNYECVDIALSKKLAINDFRLMSLCKHQIISNSSFSWWAAWLNKNSTKIVLSPNRWYNDEPLNSLALEHTVPADWIRVTF